MSKNRPTHFSPGGPVAAQPGGDPVTFRIRNLGPIGDASLRPGRLTVIAGRNNTGKTLIAHLLYGFLDAWRYWPGALDVILEHAPLFPDMIGAADDLRGRGRAVIPLRRAQIREQQELLAAAAARDFSERDVSGVLGSQSDHYKDTKVSVDLHSSASSTMPSTARVSFGSMALTVGHVGRNAVISMEETEDESVGGELPAHIALAYSFFLLHDLFPRPLVLTADRIGISLFAHDLDFARNGLMDLLLEFGNNPHKRRGQPVVDLDTRPGHYPVPVLENIDSTRGMSDLPRRRGPLDRHNFSDAIKEMMGGYYSNAKDQIRFMSQKRDNRFNVPLRLASSSARGLSDLFFYTRFVADEGQFVILDTPDAHLDTDNQVRLARVLTGLVNAGVRLLVTTHSSFLLGELNNLMMLHGDSMLKHNAAYRVGRHPDDALDPAFVRAYIARNGKLAPARMGDYGISYPFLDRAANRVSQASELLKDVVRKERS